MMWILARIIGILAELRLTVNARYSARRMRRIGEAEARDIVDYARHAEDVLHRSSASDFVVGLTTSPSSSPLFRSRCTLGHQTAVVWQHAKLVHHFALNVIRVRVLRTSRPGGSGRGVWLRVTAAGQQTTGRNRATGP